MSNQIKKYTATQLLQSPAMQKRLNEVLGEKRHQFVSSLISALNTNKQLADCEPNSVIFAAMTAASLDLPINPSLGFAHIVPYNVKGIKVAQFQIGYKGFVQLAIRSGQYQKINALAVKQGELVKFDRLTEEIEISWIEDEEERDKAETIGYIAYFELMNGFKKTIYWTKKEMEIHAEKYSQAYKNDLKKNTYDSFWSKDFDSQGLKTVIKALISKWGIMSIEMQKAIETDQAVIDENENINYIDNPEENQIEVIGDETISNDEAMNIFKSAGDKKIVDEVLEETGYEKAIDIKKSDYEKILEKIEVKKKEKKQPETVK